MERLIIILACLLFTSCVSTPIPTVSTTQTEIAVTGATLAGDIATVKEITDVAKTTGEIPKSSVQTVIKYVDKASEEVTTLNKLITKHTGEIAEQTKVIDTLSVDVAKYKPYRVRFYSLAAGILLIVLLRAWLRLRKVFKIA